jgi:D-alanyl-D-alanine carboxypeptidase (penicillin-binding protein 5/6)
VEPSGVDEHNLSTADDLARFCRAYIDLHPEALSEFHSAPSFAYPTADNVASPYRSRPGTVTQYNHNGLIGKVQGVDGLKTGYIDESGYNVALTAVRPNVNNQGNTRFVLVLLGCASSARREADGEALLEWAFANYHTIRATIPAPEAAPLYKGREDRVPVAPVEGTLGSDSQGRAFYSYTYTTLIDRGNGLSWDFSLDSPLVAPLGVGTPVGTLLLSDTLGPLYTIDLAVESDAPEGPWYKRLVDTVRLWFQ